MKKYAIIVAGGVGKRMGTAEPKQFLLIKDRPVLWYTLQTFLKAYEDLHIILVLPAGYEKLGQSIALSTVSPGRVSTVTGGETRFHSVKNGLKLVTEESVVFVHDAVRCLTKGELIKQCYEQTLIHGSAVPAISSIDSVRMVLEDGSRPLARDQIKLVQTPQTFLSSIILPAYTVEYNEQFTDEAVVIENFNQKIHLIPGNADNIKITNPVDLIIAERFISLNEY